MNSANSSTPSNAANIGGLFTMLEGWDETVSVMLIQPLSPTEYCDIETPRARGCVLARHHAEPGDSARSTPYAVATSPGIHFLLAVQSGRFFRSSHPLVLFPQTRILRVAKLCTEVGLFV